MLVELNEKEYEILKKILKEDTDDWDEADMPVGRADMAKAHNERGKGSGDRFMTSNPKGYNYWDIDRAGKKLYWRNFLKVNLPKADNFTLHHFRLIDAKEPEEGGLWTVKFTYAVVGWWGLDFDFEVTFKANDKGETVGPGKASTEYRDKTIETTVDSLEDLSPKTSFALKKNLGGGYA